MQVVARNALEFLRERNTKTEEQLINLRKFAKIETQGLREFNYKTLSMARREHSWKNYRICIKD